MKYSNITKGAFFTKLLCVIALLGAFSTGAHAAPIVGEISYGFLLTPEDDSGTAVAMGSATHLDFFDPAYLFAATGDFAGVTSISLTDFDIDPFVAPQNIWTAGGFSFDLDSLNIVTQNDSFLSLRGFGYASGNGFDATLGEWTLSANTAGGNMFVFSAVADIPEPGPLALFGLGLVGVGMIRRRKSKRTA